MIDPAYCKHFARYNRWQNRTIYDACAKLDDVTRKRNMGAFFKSIHATLNHLLVGDRLWLSRFDGEPSGVTSLDQYLYDNFDELRQQREWTDDRTDRFVAKVTPEQIAGTLQFRRMRDQVEMTLPMNVAIMQFFNHQTHHRGQVTTLLMQCGADPGVTDLPFLPAEL
ncbi:MAG: damage-inducible protein DinB [Betaproteobacteria bacterium]|nr:MAG: damage-inducible protein DinB [Betaproteobacteria bacterium]